MQQQQTPLPEDQKLKWVELLKPIINFEITEDDDIQLPYAITYHQVGARCFLVTGGYDKSVCIWEYFPSEQQPQTNNQQPPLVPLWSSCQTLCALHTDLTGATLSFDNHELLCQRGATGSAKVL